VKFQHKGKTDQKPVADRQSSRSAESLLQAQQVHMANGNDYAGDGVFVIGTIDTRVPLSTVSDPFVGLWVH